MTEVYRAKPANFSSQFEIAACYVTCDNQYLFLQHGEEKSYAGQWGVPAGKIEKDESPREAAIRELQEETGLNTNGDLVEMGPLYVRFPNLDFTYHVFAQKYHEQPRVQLCNEHQDYCWTGRDNLLKLPLIPGEKEALHHILKLSLMRQPDIDSESSLP